MKKKRHIHKFFPVFILKSEKFEKRLVEILSSNSYLGRNDSIWNYDDVKRKWVCECGKVKWVKEKK